MVSGRQRSIRAFAQQQNQYLVDHAKAKVTTSVKRIEEKIRCLKTFPWLSVSSEGRSVDIVVNKEALQEISRLDGCYAITTNLSPEIADKKVVHDRYKDLALVEQAFRTMKTMHLELRPVYVRTEESTRGHVLVVMLSYIIIRRLRQAWRDFDLTVEDALQQLKTICAIEMVIKGKAHCLRIPEPDKQSLLLLNALNIRLPEILPRQPINVVTRKKLQNNRKAL